MAPVRRGPVSLKRHGINKKKTVKGSKFKPNSISSSTRGRAKSNSLKLDISREISLEYDNLDLYQRKLENLRDEQTLKELQKKLRITNHKTQKVFYDEGVGDILDLCDTIVTDLNSGQRVDFDHMLDCNEEKIPPFDEEKIKRNLESLDMANNHSTNDEDEIEENSDDLEDGDYSKSMDEDETPEKQPEPAKSQKIDLYGNQTNVDPERALASLKKSTRDLTEISIIQRRIRMLLNKVAEQNISVIFPQMLEVLCDGSKRENSELLSELLFTTCIPTTHILSDREMCVYMLLLALTHRCNGDDYGFDFIRCVLCHFSANKHLEMDADSRQKQRQNIVLCLSILLQFEVFTPKVISQVINELSQNLTEPNLECVLIVLKTCAFYIRKNHPSVMKEILVSLKERLKLVSDALGSRAKFLLENIIAIQNNNHLKLYGYDPTLMQDFSKLFQKISNSVPRSSGGIILSDMDEFIRNDRRGLSGYALVRTIDGSKVTAWTDPNSWQDEDKKPKWDSKMIAMAQKMKLKSQHKIDIFCSIMSAESVEGAFTNIQTLKLGGTFRNDIPFVILDCCLQSKEYNPFFIELARKFVECHRSFKTSLQFALWDRIRAVQSSSGVSSKTSQFQNLVQFFSRIISSRSLPLSSLKIFTFEGVREQPTAISLNRSILSDILQHNTKSTIKLIFNNIQKGGKSSESFRHSLEFFILKFLNPYNDKDQKSQSQTELQQRTLYALKLLRYEEESFGYIPQQTTLDDPSVNDHDDDGINF